MQVKMNRQSKDCDIIFIVNVCRLQKRICMLKKDELLNKIELLRKKYEKEGIVICGIFGSYAREDNTRNSDVDIAYKINKTIFSKRYKGFKAASKIADVSNEISREIGEKVDFVSIDSLNASLNQKIKSELSS